MSSRSGSKYLLPLEQVSFAGSASSVIDQSLAIPPHYPMPVPGVVRFSPKVWHISTKNKELSLSSGLEVESYSKDTM